MSSRKPVPLTKTASSLTAQAQVIDSVHVGGPDACVGLAFSPGCDANFSLTALGFANGKGVGQYNDSFAGDTGGFHAKIDCISISGNEAWVSGVIVTGNSGDTDLAGLPIITRVRDNGRSAKDPADEIGFSSIGNDTSCLDQPDLDLFIMPQGQVSVRSR